MIDIKQVKEKIKSFLEKNGPSLPVSIAKEIEMSPVFASAIISEMINARTILSSHMRLGSSPWYFLPGQEQKLEEKTDSLKSVEKEALTLLQKNSTLKDEEQEPAIRIALRAIKDFAKPEEAEGKIIWKYAFAKEEPKVVEEKKEEIIEEKEQPEEIEEEKIETIKEEPPKKEEPIIIEEKEEPKFESPFEDKEDIEFFDEIKEFLKTKNLKIIEEIQIEKKEVVAKVETESSLGNLKFLLIARNKKSVNESEINSALQRTIYEKMPCIYIIRKEPPKKIQTILSENNLINLEVVEENNKP